MLDFFAVSLVSRAMGEQFSSSRSEPAPRRRVRELLGRLRRRG
jgi:hypothetical protein